MLNSLDTSAYLKRSNDFLRSIPQRVKGTPRMRLIAYALSAACGCAPVGYNYYQRAYYPPQTAYYEPYDNYTPSAWGGESALPVGYAYGYTPSYYVGAPYQDYGYQYVPQRRPIRIQIEARNHHAPSVRVALAAKKTKVAASVPLPKADPRKRVAHHHYPSKMVAIEEN